MRPRRRYYVSQLNAAGTEVARQHGFELVDYYQVGWGPGGALL